MKKLNNKGFSLVELLVVITILAIISVVAYQNFGGAVDKAISGRKISDIRNIETALQQFKTENNYYPMPMIYDQDKNKWGYNSGSFAYPSNTITVSYDKQEIISINSGSGGGKVFGTGSYSGTQIGAKGVIGYTNDFGKKYLSKDLYDPELGDIKVGNDKMIDFGIGRYVYAIYAQPKDPSLWNKQGNGGIYYNIAATIKQKNSDLYESYIIGDYDENSCGDKKSDCPTTLIGTLSGITTNEVLKNKTIQDVNKSTTQTNQGIPYPIKDFSN